MTPQPDPLTPTPEQVERYVASLRELDDPAQAQREAWSQIRLAGVRARTRRAEALRSLELIFRLGTAPRIDGETRGVWLTPSLPTPLQALVRAATSVWMPWMGKRLDAPEQRGENLVVADARLPIKAIWPSHRPKPLGDGRLAVFGFDTRTAPSEDGQTEQVLKIDYDRADNPALVVRNVLDELVEVVPGAYLGKMLLRRGPAAPHRETGWFALQQPG